MSVVNASEACQEKARKWSAGNSSVESSGKAFLRMQATLTGSTHIQTKAALHAPEQLVHPLVSATLTPVPSFFPYTASELPCLPLAELVSYSSTASLSRSHGSGTPPSCPRILFPHSHLPAAKKIVQIEPALLADRGAGKTKHIHENLALFVEVPETLKYLLLQKLGWIGSQTALMPVHLVLLKHLRACWYNPQTTNRWGSTPQSR